MWVFPRIGGNPKMDGENNGKDLGVPLFSETPMCVSKTKRKNCKKNQQ